jgi:hypothetical protein
MGIKCFWIEPVAQVRMSLRRYASEKWCSGQYGYHNASVVIGDALLDSSFLKVCADRRYGATHGDLWPHSDARWPKHCGCGYEFKGEDEWQFNPHRLYMRTDTGELMTEVEAPAGAMRHEWWMENFQGVADQNGIILGVKLPDGTWWCVDGPASSGNGGWTRTGEIPNVTASPSILTSNYHGWLRNGELVDC